MPGPVSESYRGPRERKPKSRPMKEITIGAAKSIAERFGYDQVVVIARRVAGRVAGLDCNGGESLTTYGINRAHCDIAARIGDFMKYRVMEWPIAEGRRVEAAVKALAALPETKDLPLAKLGAIATVVFDAAAKA